MFGRASFVLALLCAALVATLSGCVDNDDDGLFARATVAPGHAASTLALGPGSAAAGASSGTDDHPDGFLSAEVVRPGETISGTLETMSDTDWFAIDLRAQQPLELGFSCFGGARVVVVAPDGSTDVQAGAPGTAQLTFVAQQDGVHFLRVETESGRDLYYDIELR